MSSAQFRMQSPVFFPQLSPCFAICLDRGIHNSFERQRFSLRLAISPGRLDWGTERRALAYLESDYRQTKNIRHDLTHGRTLGPTTADSQFIGGDAEVDKSLHSISKSNNDSINLCSNLVPTNFVEFDAVNYGAITRKSVISWEKTGPNVRPFGPGRERRTFLRRRAVPTRRDPECHRRRLPHSSCTPVPANDRRYRKMRRFLLLNQSPGFLKMHKRRRKRQG